MKFILTDNTISLTIGTGKLIVIDRNNKKFNEVRRLIKEGKEDELVELLERKEKTLEEYVNGSNLFLIDGVLRDADGEALPAVLSNRLIEMKEEGFDVSHMAKFWDNLKKNPSLRSREQLYKFLEQNGHPITPDGHFIAYRGIRNDFKDHHTGTFDNSPGNVLEMPRRDVDDNPNQTCSRGFHVAAWEYASTFGNGVTVEVKVNPMDVVAVPTDYNGQKMRVCKFEVIQVVENSNNGVVYGYGDGDANQDFDAYEAEPELSDDDIENILDWAEHFQERYTDRTSLAARIEEEVYWVSVAEILKVLNERL